MDNDATPRAGDVRSDVSLLTDNDLFLFNEGSHFRLYEKMGAHPQTAPDGEAGVYFAVWAPNAEQVSVIGGFNEWTPGRHPLVHRGTSGIWEGFVPGVAPGESYKYRVHGRMHGYAADKADPLGFRHETPPFTASIVCPLEYEWNDAEWMASRGGLAGHGAPVSIYEVHLGSWMRHVHGGNQPYNYRELAHALAEHVLRLGFTHIELLPVMEHPFYGSWGYQTTGYFAPTARYGGPADFMYFVDFMHQNGIGVILDWVPSHFPSDGHGLSYFDGTHLYEHADPRQGFHPDWRSSIFNYGRNEVQSFLYSSAFFWADKYHADGLRVDAVASMLYLDYSRRDGEWVPNQFGGNENLEAIQFLRRLNHELYARFGGFQTFAEESTAWPMVSRPTYLGGLGFGYKWDMGWMNDTLTYFGIDPVFRKYHQNQLTFRMLYAFSENYVLPLSHDEVVHGKGSLLGKMPGDPWQKFANLRLLLGAQFLSPGKKLLFMGGEFAQWREWAHDEELDWALLAFPSHRGTMRWVCDLNRLYREIPALHELDTHPDGFEWVDCCDNENSVIAFLRKGRSKSRTVLAVFNFTPVPRYHYKIGVPRPGFWREALNGDAEDYGGSGLGNCGGFDCDPVPCHGHPWSLNLLLPPLSCLVFEHAGGGDAEPGTISQ